MIDAIKPFDDGRKKIYTEAEVYALFAEDEKKAKGKEKDTSLEGKIETESSEVVSFHGLPLIKKEYEALQGIAQQYFNKTVEEYFGNVNTIGERSCYDESKRIAETLTAQRSVL